MFCAFWLRNVLRATTACDFSFPTLRSHKPLKNIVIRGLSTFSCACIFLLLTLWSSLFFSSLLFPCLIFSDSSHLCFLSVHIVGSLTSKLPLISWIKNWWRSSAVAGAVSAMNSCASCAAYRSSGMGCCTAWQREWQLDVSHKMGYTLPRHFFHFICYLSSWEYVHGKTSALRRETCTSMVWSGVRSY